MAAPIGVEGSKAYYTNLYAEIDKLVKDGVVATSTTVANTLVAIAAEIVAR